MYDAYIGSCVLDSVTLVLARSNYDTRSGHIIDLVHNVYYDAFSNAVSHVNGSVQMFSREDFIKEVKRLAVYCGVQALSVLLDMNTKEGINDDNVIALFKAVWTTGSIFQPPIY